jgi:hypothetical protein
MSQDHGITSVTVVGWNAPPVTYTSPLSYDDHDGLVRIGIASTSTTPRQMMIYPQNSLKSIQLSFG